MLHRALLAPESKYEHHVAKYLAESLPRVSRVLPYVARLLLPMILQFLSVAPKLASPLRSCRSCRGCEMPSSVVCIAGAVRRAEGRSRLVGAVVGSALRKHIPRQKVLARRDHGKSHITERLVDRLQHSLMVVVGIRRYNQPCYHGSCTIISASNRMI